MAVPGERHGDDASEGFRQQARTAAVGQPVGLTGDEHKGDGVEEAETGPHQQHGRYFTVAGNGIDDAAEQDWLGDGDDGKHDVGDNDHTHTKLVCAKITEGPGIDLKQRHEREAFPAKSDVRCFVGTWVPSLRVVMTGSGKSSLWSSKFDDECEIFRDFSRFNHSMHANRLIFAL